MVRAIAVFAAFAGFLSLPASAADAIASSAGLYRIPFTDGLWVQVFDDARSHQPPGRLDLFATRGTKPFAVVAAAPGRVMAIQDGFSEQQSGRSAKECHNNYVWIAHANGEWSNYSHLAHRSVTDKARLRVGDQVRAGQYLGDEGAVGCAMLDHVHFEIGMPDSARPMDAGGFLTDNENGKRNRIPRLCGVPGGEVAKGALYKAAPCQP